MNRSAALFVAVSLVAGLGGTAMSLTAAVWVLSLTGSSALAALASFFVFAPTLLGPLLGALVDRAPVRPVLVGTNLTLAALLASLLAVRDRGDVWHIFAVMLAYGVSYVVVDAAESRLVVAVVPRDALGTLGGLRLGAQEATKLVAPLVGAGVFVVAGGATVALGAAAMLAVAAGLYLLVGARPEPARGQPEPAGDQPAPVGDQPEPARDRPPRRMWTDIARGVRYLRTQPLVAWPVLVAAIAMLGSGVATAGLYGVVADALHRPPAFIGVLSSIQGGAAIVAGLLVGPLLTRLGGEPRLALLGAAVFGLGPLAQASGWLPAVLAGSALVGLGLPWAVVAAFTAVQRHTPPELLGTVTGPRPRWSSPRRRWASRSVRCSCPQWIIGSRWWSRPSSPPVWSSGSPVGYPGWGPAWPARLHRGVARRVVVVGGGIAGLAAAHRLRELGPDLDIVVLDRADRLGGKIHTQPFAGRPIETGAETFLMRDAGGESAALRLAGRLGLADALVHPVPVPAALAVDGRLVPIPGGTLLGIPADPAAVASIARVAGADGDEGRPLLAAGEDVTVGALVRSRFGDEVVDRLVDPLLGGVYAGHADGLSLQATIPGLHRAAQQCPTLAGAVAQAMGQAPRPAGVPVFASVQGGLSRFVTAVAEAARSRLELSQTVRALDRTATGWRLTVGATRSPSYVDADAVVLAVPAAPAARLLRSAAAPQVATVEGLPYASVALVTMALPAGTGLPPLSGFLVPADQGVALKAVTFMSAKWPHLPPGPVIVRASLGRHGDTGVLHRTDESLVELVRDELARLLGAALPAPSASRVTRWGGALPQYGVGHVAGVAALRSALPPTLALAGAAFDGVGIAACVRSGEAAADQVWQAIQGQAAPTRVAG